MRVIPAPIKIAGGYFAGNEAPIQLDPLAPCLLEPIDRPAEAVEQTTSVGSRAERRVHLVPLGQVDTWGKQAVRCQGREHNTTILLC